MSNLDIFTEYYTLPKSAWEDIKAAAEASPYASVFEDFNLWTDTAYESDYNTSVVFIPVSALSDNEIQWLLFGDDEDFEGGFDLGHEVFTRSTMPVFTLF